MRAHTKGCRKMCRRETRQHKCVSCRLLSRQARRFYYQGDTGDDQYTHHINTDLKSLLHNALCVKDTYNNAYNLKIR